MPEESAMNLRLDFLETLRAGQFAQPFRGVVEPTKWGINLPFKTV